MALAVVALAKREDIVRLAPPLAGAYAALGLPVNVQGLEWREVRTSLVTEASQKVLAVEGEIRKIVRLAFAGDPNMHSLSMSMTDKLMTDETAESLEPLRQTLQLSGEEYRDGIFAWKGFLYYSWNINAMISFVPELQRQLLSLKFLRATSDEANELNAIRRRVTRCLSTLAKIVTSGVDNYREAYQALIEGKPAAFRGFLKEAPSRFLEVGEASAMIMHIRLFWDYRFRERRQAWLDVEEGIDIFRDFDSHVSGIASVTGEGSDDATLFGSAVSARSAFA
jgi:hypothetical protein